jgi:hypothetical protein
LSLVRAVLLVQALQRQTAQLRQFRRNRSNHCRPKRLKPDQQTQTVRPQYVGTKKLYRSAAGLTPKMSPSIRAVTNLK